MSHVEWVVNLRLKKLFLLPDRNEAFIYWGQIRPFILQDDLYLCSTKQPVATRKPLDGGYQDLDYRYLYKISWPQLVGAQTSAQQQKNMAQSKLATTTSGNNSSLTK